MTSRDKILDFLSPHTLEELYEGHKEGILLVLGKKIITGGLVRLRVRDAVHEDNAVADSAEQLGEVEVGDIRLFTNSICLHTPYWRRSLMPGRGMLVARIEDLDTTGLPESRTLPDHKTKECKSCKCLPNLTKTKKDLICQFLNLESSVFT